MALATSGLTTEDSDGNDMGLSFTCKTDTPSKEPSLEISSVKLTVKGIKAVYVASSTSDTETIVPVDDMICRELE